MVVAARAVVGPVDAPRVFCASAGLDTASADAITNVPNTDAKMLLMPRSLEPVLIPDESRTGPKVAILQMGRKPGWTVRRNRN
ncbi:MAG: hypothetical protein WAM17_20085 [Rhodoplanes sp.]